jgi:hypothetical protein
MAMQKAPSMMDFKYLFIIKVYIIVIVTEEMTYIIDLPHAQSNNVNAIISNEMILNTDCTHTV